MPLKRLKAMRPAIALHQKVMRSLMRDGDTNNDDWLAELIAWLAAYKPNAELRGRPLADGPA